MNSTKMSISTIRPGELEQFDTMSDDWWDLNGSCKALHSMNHLRIPYILNGLLDTGVIDKVLKQDPLKGLKILDVGSGAGILTEALGHLGAEVLGLEPSHKLFQVAVNHLPQSLSKNVKYICSTLEELEIQHPEFLQNFDILIASEVVDHVLNPDIFVKLCSKMVKPGGSLFMTTITRNYLSWFGVILLAEYILGFIPKGTHFYNHFIKPEELEEMFLNCNCLTKSIEGSLYLPILNKWIRFPLKIITYSIHVQSQK